VESPRLSTHPRRRPDSHPGSLQDGAQTPFRSTVGPRAFPLPARSAALRREESGSTRRQVVTKDARPPPRPFTAREYSHGRRPAPDDWRPLREAIARGLHEATPATSALAEFPWVHRSPAKRTEVLSNPTLSRTIVSLRELDYSRKKKIKQSRKFLCVSFASPHNRCTHYPQFDPQAAESSPMRGQEKSMSSAELRAEIERSP